MKTYTLYPKPYTLLAILSFLIIIFFVSSELLSCETPPPCICCECYNNCQRCNWNTNECTGLSCRTEMCEQCDGWGHCVTCNGDATKMCCIGSGQCYDPNTQACCGINGTGQVYNLNTQQCCGDVRNGYHVCDKNKDCCTNGCCDPAKCEECIDGECKACGGDSSKKCCPDGSCAKPCELEPSETTCTGEMVTCPYGCELFCEHHRKIVYTGNTVYRCKEPGCPGDCQDDEVECSKEYECTSYVYTYSTCVGSLCINIYTLPGHPYDECPSCVTKDPENAIKINKVASKKCRS